MKITVNIKTNSIFLDEGGATLGEITDYLSYFCPDFKWKELRIDRPVKLEFEEFGEQPKQSTTSMLKYPIPQI